MNLSAVSFLRTMKYTFATGRFGLSASLSLLSLVICSEVHAESVEYEGRQFAVESIKEIDEKNVAIEISGQSVFASRDTIGKLAFKIYATKPELLVRGNAFNGYGAWLASLASRGHGDEAEMAIARVVSSQTIDAGKRTSFLEELVESPAGEKALFHAVSSLEKGDATSCSALAFLSADSQQQLRAPPSRSFDWISVSCPEALVATAQQLMREGERVRGVSALRAIANMVSGSGGFADAAHASLARIDALDQALQTQDASQLEAALKLASFDTLLGDYFTTARPELVVEFSSESLRKGRPGSALRGLSLLDFSNRTDAHHELVARALRELTFEDRGVVEDGGVRKLLWSYATKDDVVRQQYLSMLEDWVQLLLAAHKPDEALRLFELIKELRLDPSVENDTVRSNIAEGFVDDRKYLSADAVLAGVRTELPWLYRFRLLLKRDIYMLIMVLLGCVVILRWIFMFVRVAIRQSAERQSAQATERRAAEVADRERFHAQFANSDLRADGFMDIDEYAAGLKKFSLHPTASLADIKNAYRHVVKTLHPDINPGASKENTDVFIELTRTYERLLVLHAERERRSKSSK